MNLRRVLVLAGAVVILCLGGAVLAGAQSGAPSAPKTPDNEDPALKAHVAYLVKALESPNAIIRRSAHQALVAVGKPALPQVEAAVAARPEGETKSPVARVLQAIQTKLARAATKGGAGALGPAGKAAAPARRVGGPSEQQVAEILTAAGIDSTLAGEVKRAMDAQRIALQDLKREAAAGLDPAAIKEKRRAITRAYREKLTQVLGPDQAKAFHKALADRRANRADGDEKPAKKPRSDRADLRG